MKTILTGVCCLVFSICLFSQPHSSDQVTLMLLVQNERGASVDALEIRAELQGGDEVHKVFTNKSGRASINLWRGKTYHIFFNNEKAIINTPTEGRTYMTKKLIVKETYPTVAGAIDTIVQNLSKAPKPSEHEATLILNIGNTKKQPLADLKVLLVQKDINKAFAATTNENGFVYFSLPSGYEYQIDVAEDQNYRTVKVPDRPFMTQKKGFTYITNQVELAERISHDTLFQKVGEKPVPTRDRVLVEVTVLDLDGLPLSDEKVFFEGLKWTISGVTDSTGKTYLLVPKGDSYAVNFEYSDSLEVIKYETGNYTRTDKIQYKYIGSAAIRARELERLLQQQLWDSLTKVQSFRDSLAAARSEFSGFTDKIGKMSQDDLERLVIKRAEQDGVELAKNPKYLEQIGDEVAAPLYRNRNKWKNKLIVQDLTGSMFPYFDQVFSWHILQRQFGGESRYLFFNDGDNTPDKEKVIGATGGLYFTEAQKFEDFTTSIKQTTTGGYGGDGPENDIEALLKAVSMKKDIEEIILIADNYSDMRDFTLLEQLNVPIRIVLAGCKLWVNEQYLELAYRTKGSVHLLEEDLEELFLLNDGDYIEIGRLKYRVSRGKFLKVSDL